jgi:hypothetical protein
MRADCRFVHDLKTITCKYWLEGECLKGDACEFLHEHVEEEVSAKNLLGFSFGSVNSSHSVNSSGKKKKPGENNEQKKAKSVRKDFKLETEEFPALGGGPGSPAPPTATSTDAKSNNNRKVTNEVSVDVKKEASTPPVIESKPAETPLNAQKVANAAPPVKTAASVLLANVVGGPKPKSESSPAVNTPVKSLASVLAQSTKVNKPPLSNSKLNVNSNSTSANTAAKTATPVISIKVKENSASSNGKSNASRANSKTRGNGGGGGGGNNKQKK